MRKHGEMLPGPALTHHPSIKYHWDSMVTNCRDFSFLYNSLIYGYMYERKL